MEIESPPAAQVEDPQLPENPPFPIPDPRRISQPSSNGGEQQPQEDDPGDTSGVGGSCRSQYSQLLKKCETAYTDASYTCDEKNDAGLNNVSNTASQLANQTNQQGQQGSNNVNTSCNNMADISRSANNALASYRSKCLETMDTCTKKCQELSDFTKAHASCVGSSKVTKAKRKLESCNDDFIPKMENATTAMQNYNNTGSNASQCGQQSNDGQSPQSGDKNKDEEKKPPLELCVSAPNTPGCASAAKTDCSNPEYAATSKVCICMKNPQAPDCGGSGDSSDRPTASSGGGNDGGMDSAGGGSSGNYSGSPSTGQREISTGAGSQNNVDGRQGGDVSFGSAGGSAKGKTNPSSGSSNQAEKAAAGSSGGGSSGKGAIASFLSSLMGDDDEGPRGRGGSKGGGGQNAQGAQGPDLRQFLPGGKLAPPPEKVSGSQRPEDIAGPHSIIWQNVKNRYRIITPTLLMEP